MTGRKKCALQVPPVVPYIAYGNFPKALCGKTGGTCSAHVFRPVMRQEVYFKNKFTKYQASYAWYTPTKTLAGIIFCITICDVDSFHKLAIYTFVRCTLMVGATPGQLPTVCKPY